MHPISRAVHRLRCDSGAFGWVTERELLGIPTTRRRAAGASAGTAGSTSECPRCPPQNRSSRTQPAHPSAEPIGSTFAAELVSVSTSWKPSAVPSRATEGPAACGCLSTRIRAPSNGVPRAATRCERRQKHRCPRLCRERPTFERRFGGVSPAAPLVVRSPASTGR
uniref:Uncharacterized protein n=1 Tax=uncultured prokaryote TaxID=198431 RepID=A0A0H5Q7X8_9ZZZZ|nr:hypothetical protein [uncultured prokaryote]